MGLRGLSLGQSRLRVRPRVVALLVSAVGAAAVAAAWGLEGPRDAVEPPPVEAVREARVAPPLREYPSIDAADLWPERPPSALVRGFPPPPKPGPLYSAGPVRRLAIPRFEVEAAIEVLSVTPTNEMPTPVDGSYRAGWYTDFGQPGTGGNAVFTAHETWNHYQAPFFNLGKLEVGDAVLVDMADGRHLEFSVITNVRYDVNTIPMAAILWPPARGADEWITLITCGGRIVYDERTGYGEYLDRDVVTARRVR